MDINHVSTRNQEYLVGTGIGVVHQYVGTTTPDGFYDCTKTSTADFVELSKTVYAKLYEVVGDRYTTAAGSDPQEGNFWIPLICDAEGIFNYIIRVS